MKIALISCSKAKKNYACQAHELYSASDLFSLSYQYAKKIADRIYILSAKYGLVHENMVIAPYNQTLKEMNRQDQLSWASRVITDLNKECNIYQDYFILLAGNTYCRDLISYLPNYSMPLQGLRMGERLAWLNRQLDGNPLTETEYRRLCELCTRGHFQSEEMSTRKVPHNIESAKMIGTGEPHNFKSCRLTTTGKSHVETMPYTGKYMPLLKFLKGQTQNQVILAFSQAESILGFKLPKSAYTYTVWWNPIDHPHCQAWLQAGFNVPNTSQCIQTRTITFVRF